jgi:hypothetical protein
MIIVHRNNEFSSLFVLYQRSFRLRGGRTRRKLAGWVTSAARWVLQTQPSVGGDGYNCALALPFLASTSSAIRSSVSGTPHSSTILISFADRYLFRESVRKPSGVPE